ncbi:MAG: hypothetical protein LLG00_11240 [Planctomycetaceae bacterium]|nr:hypothetical protein [Planctomycetaceae bacterium]
MAPDRLPANRPILLGFSAGVLLAAVIAVAPAHAQGRLETLRDDVRNSNVGGSAAAPRDDRSANEQDSQDTSSNTESSNSTSSGTGEGWQPSFDQFFLGVGAAAGLAVTSPFWAPYTALGDALSDSRYFSPFPYDGDQFAYMTLISRETTRPWAAQFATDYGTIFDNLDAVSGRLVLSTTSRFGVDASAHYFEERLPRNRHDNLWLGDANLVFCFARNEQMQWRTGLGVNWLDDRQQADIGFNFTYGFDWFPAKPWVISAELDWGNLGRSSLFHFRSTVGAIVNRFEVYTGYEYYDFDRFHTNSLIAGVRVWF